MANISSYNQLSSWNEDDDLLFVQQPDAPKKAHPSQMKQYVEAGDFEATGEVKDGHGNVLSGVANEIGDLSQTGLTGDSVAEQLSDVSSDLAIIKVPNTFITLGTGISITTNDLYKQGNHIFGWITFGFSAQNPNNLILGTINSGYRPSGRIIRMSVGLGTEPWAAEYAGYVLKEYDHTLHLMGYANNIKSAHIHLDYVV